jgi:hypothetical protein
MRKELLIGSLVVVFIVGCSSEEKKEKTTTTQTTTTITTTATTAPATDSTQQNSIDELNTPQGVDKQIPAGEGTTQLTPSPEKIQSIESGLGIDQTPQASNEVTPLTETSENNSGTSVVEQQEELSSAMQNANEAVQNVQQMLTETQKTLKESNLSDLENQASGNSSNLTGLGTQNPSSGTIQTLKDVNQRMEKEMDKGSAVTGTDMDIATQPTPVNFSGKSNQSSPEESTPTENTPAPPAQIAAPATSINTGVVAPPSSPQPSVVSPGTTTSNVNAPVPDDNNE